MVVFRIFMPFPFPGDFVLLFKQEVGCAEEGVELGCDKGLVLGCAEGLVLGCSEGVRLLDGLLDGLELGDKPTRHSSRASLPFALSPSVSYSTKQVSPSLKPASVRVPKMLVKAEVPFKETLELYPGGRSRVR